MTQAAAPAYLISERLRSEGVAHGFFGRAGGVSTGDYATLNTGPGSSDQPDAVAENRRRCAAALGAKADRLLTVHQVHSPDVVVVEGPWQGPPPRADALVTTTPGLAIGVLAADCMPFLFLDPEAGVIGAAHAGWRGALSGVLEASVATMVRLGAQPARIRAAVGPCLRQDNFEVGSDLVSAFRAVHGGIDDLFKPGAAAGKFLFDLVGFGRRRLAAVGVTNLDEINACTLGAPDRYFSYRASRRAGAPDYGRNLSAIMRLR